MIFYHRFFAGLGCHRGLGTGTRVVAVAVRSVGATAAGIFDRSDCCDGTAVVVRARTHLRSDRFTMAQTCMVTVLHIKAAADIDSAVDTGFYIYFDFDSGTDVTPLVPQYFHSFWRVPILLNLLLYLLPYLPIHAHFRRFPYSAVLSQHLSVPIWFSQSYSSPRQDQSKIKPDQ